MGSLSRFKLSLPQCNVPGVLNCMSQGSTLAVFRYPEHPKFSDGIPDSPEQ